MTYCKVPKFWNDGTRLFGCVGSDPKTHASSPDVRPRRIRPQIKLHDRMYGDQSRKYRPLAFCASTSLKVIGTDTDRSAT